MHKRGSKMSFEMPVYHHPDFSQEMFVNAPDAVIETAVMDGVVPEYFHSTSMYPEYFKINGEWKLAEESRMDSCVVVRDSGRLDVVEARNIKKDFRIIVHINPLVSISSRWNSSEALHSRTRV